MKFSIDLSLGFMHGEFFSIIFKVGLEHAFIHVNGINYSKRPTAYNNMHTHILHTIITSHKHSTIGWQLHTPFTSTVYVYACYTNNIFFSLVRRHSRRHSRIYLIGCPALSLFRLFFWFVRPFRFVSSVKIETNYERKP